MKNIKQLLSFTLICLCLQTSAQKLALTVSNRHKKLILQELSGAISVQGYKGDKIIITLTHFTNENTQKTPTDIGVQVKLTDQEITLLGQLENHAQVSYTIMMPEHLALITSRNCKKGGEIKVKGLMAECEINNCERITVEQMKGPIILNAVSGDIIVKQLSDKWNGPCYLSTTSGNITMELLSNFSCAISAESLLGKVNSQFTLASHKEKEVPIIRANRLEGIIGDGGPFLNLSNISGNITLKKLVK